MPNGIPRRPPCTAIFGHYQVRYARDESGRHTVKLNTRQPRCSLGVSLAAAITVFPLALFVAGMSSRALLIVLVDSGSQFWGLSDNVVIGFFAAVAIVPAYALSRCVYMCLRWQSSDHAGAEPPSCRNCDYNLTGNTSGICPECGAAIQNQRVRRKRGGGGKGDFTDS